MKNILIVFCGGTFSMKIDEQTGGAVPHFHGDELLKLIPEAKGISSHHPEKKGRNHCICHP